MIFASTPPINDDPKPIRSRVNGARFRNLGEAPLSGEDSPRREYDRPRAHEANPILLELRQLRGADWVRPERYKAQYEMMLRWIDDPEASAEDQNPWTFAQRSHARRVLTRLANFS